MRLVIGFINCREKKLIIGDYSFDEGGNYLILYDENNKVSGVVALNQMTYWYVEY